MALIASQIVDRISIRAGLLLLLLGAASVIHWRATERAGAGNVMPYGMLQGCAVVILLLLTALMPSRYTRGNDPTGSSAGTCSARYSNTSTRRCPGSVTS